MTLPALFDCFPQTAIIWWVVFIISGRDSNSEEAEPDRDPREHPGHLPPEPDKPGAAADPSLWQKLLSHLLQTFWRQRGRSVGAECLVWKTQVLVPGQSRSLDVSLSERFMFNLGSRFSIETWQPCSQQCQTSTGCLNWANCVRFSSPQTSLDTLYFLVNTGCQLGHLDFLQHYYGLFNLK